MTNFPYINSSLLLSLQGMSSALEAASSMKGITEAAYSMSGAMEAALSADSLRLSDVQPPFSESEPDDDENGATSEADSRASTEAPDSSDPETFHRAEPVFFLSLSTYESPSRSPQELSTAVLDVWALVLPNRIRTEDVGGYVEHINQLAAAGASPWRIYIRTASAVFWTFVNSLRVASCLLIAKLLNELGKWWAGG